MGLLSRYILVQASCFNWFFLHMPVWALCKGFLACAASAALPVQDASEVESIPSFCPCRRAMPPPSAASGVCTSATKGTPAFAVCKPSALGRWGMGGC